MVNNNNIALKHRDQWTWKKQEALPHLPGGHVPRRDHDQDQNWCSEACSSFDTTGNEIAEFKFFNEEVSTSYVVKRFPASVCRTMMLCYDAFRTRDLSLPQRGDPRRYALVREQRGHYSNPAYVNIGDEVYCGILELMPHCGCSFAHPHWGLLPRAQARVLYNEEQNFYAKRALSCIQTDLRHKLGKAAGSVNRRSSTNNSLR